MTNSKYNAHTNPLFKSLTLLKIKDIFEVQCMEFWYRFVNDNVPIVCNMSTNCLGLEVLTGQVRLWSNFLPSPHLYRRRFMSSIYDCDLKRNMCVNKTPTAKVFMPSITQCLFWNVHHHHLYLRHKWVNVSPLLDHQLCIMRLIRWRKCPLRCAVPLHLQGGLYGSDQLWS